MKYELDREEVIFRLICALLRKSRIELRIELRDYIQNKLLMLAPIVALNENIKSLDNVESVSINGDCIQLNLEVKNGGI